MGVKKRCDALGGDEQGFLRVAFSLLASFFGVFEARRGHVGTWVRGYVGAAVNPQDWWSDREPWPLMACRKPGFVRIKRPRSLLRQVVSKTRA